MALTTGDIDFVRRLVEERSSIVLDESKSYLIESRLTNLAMECRLASAADLVADARQSHFGPVAERIVDALTTNETSWLRDLHPYDLLRDKILPEVADARHGGPIQIWSAACSSGQEPYGLAMMIAEDLPHLRHRVRILATDISAEMVKRTTEAVYSQLEVNRGVPAAWLNKYFVRSGARFQVKPEIRAVVSCFQQNLTHAYTTVPPVDVVLLRNVLVYFNRDVKRDVLARMRQVLRPDGWLLLGASESTVGIDDSWRREALGRTNFYRP